MRQADVTSIEAITAFRAHFITYLADAGLALDQAAEEITRTRVWLQNDQRTHWEREVRHRRSVLEQAQQQLLSAQLTPELRSTDMAKRDFHRAERAMAEAEAKLACVRRDASRYESVVGSKVKGLDGLRNFLTSEGPKAVAFLNGTVDALHAYTETRPELPPAPEPATTPEPAPPDAAQPGDAP